MMQDALQRLFPDGVVLEVAVAADEDERLLYDGERAAMSGMVDGRRREFAAGRNAARRALARLGIAPGELARREGARDVVWPSGIIGSISHTAGLRAVACARTVDFNSVGLDVEKAGSLSAEVAAEICRPGEVDLFAGEAPLPSDWPRLLFAIKEAAFKAWYPVTRRMLAFHDMLITPDIELNSFRAEVLSAPVEGLSIAGRFGWNDAFVFAGAVLARR